VSDMSDVLGRGNIYFVYRPRVEHLRAEGLEDVQRFFVMTIGSIRGLPTLTEGPLCDARRSPPRA
jgi:hypothetical protein